MKLYYMPKQRAATTSGAEILTETLRARCSTSLRARVDAYIAQERKKGHAVSDGDVVRDAVIAYLDAADREAVERMKERAVADQLRRAQGS